MILRHATPDKNIRGIEELGLLPSLSRGSHQVVWLHAPKLTHWAILHVSRRHQVDPDSIRVLTVFVPSTWVKRRASGLWYCDRVIPPAQIAGSPAWYASAIVGTRETATVAVEEAVALDPRD